MKPLQSIRKFFEQKLQSISKLFEQKPKPTIVIGETEKLPPNKPLLNILNTKRIPPVEEFLVATANANELPAPLAPISGARRQHEKPGQNDSTVLSLPSSPTSWIKSLGTTPASAQTLGDDFLYLMSQCPDIMAYEMARIVSRTLDYFCTTHGEALSNPGFTINRTSLNGQIGVAYIERTIPIPSDKTGIKVHSRHSFPEDSGAELLCLQVSLAPVIVQLIDRAIGSGKPGPLKKLESLSKLLGRASICGSNEMDLGPMDTGDRLTCNSPLLDYERALNNMDDLLKLAPAKASIATAK